MAKVSKPAKKAAKKKAAKPARKGPGRPAGASKAAGHEPRKAQNFLMIPSVKRRALEVIEQKWPPRTVSLADYINMAVSEKNEREGATLPKKR